MGEDREDVGPSGSESVRTHEPVMVDEVLELLELTPGMVVVDGTVGAGGHSAAMLPAITPGGVLVGLDRDSEILERARESLAESGGDSRDRSGVRLMHLEYSRMAEALEQAGIDGCDRVLLDLGVSSLHLDSPQRGFSFMHDAPLDMRMNASAPVTAAEWLRRVSEADLANVLFELGGERHSRRIARAVVEARSRGKMSRTSHLVDAVRRGTPSGARRQRIHFATRTFQAVRMALNDEMGELQRGLQAALSVLRPGGRLAVISFHSGEDRMVKHFVREHMKPLRSKPLQATGAERRRNPRSRSAKLRCGVVVASESGDPARVS